MFARWKLPGRRAMHLFARSRLRLRSRLLGTSRKDSSTLVVAPHPDDEALGCSGLIATRCALGAPVNVLYVTDGSASHPQHPIVTPQELARRRESEAFEAMGLLGLKPESLHFVGAPDGRLSNLSAEETPIIVGKIATALAQFRPDEIFLPGPDDGSTEHTAAYKLVQLALQTYAQPYRQYEYPVWSWWNPLFLFRPLATDRPVYRLPLGPHRALKRRVLQCYHTQVEPLAPWTSPLLTSDFIHTFDSPSEYFIESGRPLIS